MNRTFIGVVLLWLLASALTVTADAAERLTDRELRALLDQIDEARGRFDSALDGEVRNRVLRSPTGEVDVDRYLDDFDRNIDVFKSRIRSEYAASSEAAIVLRQASAIERFFRSQQTGIRGESEWNSFVTHLKTLAATYGSSFPIVEPATIRRLSRRELATSAETVAQSVDRFRRLLDDDLRDDATVDKPTRESIVAEAHQLRRDAQGLRSRVDDDDPSSAEADRLFARATRMQQYVDGRKLPTAADAWSAVASQVRQLAAAYRTTW